MWQCYCINGNGHTYPASRHRVVNQVQWKVGDIIGLGCDLVQIKLFYSVNGVQRAFSFRGKSVMLPKSVKGLFPCKTGLVKYNFGTVPFRVGRQDVPAL